MNGGCGCPPGRILHPPLPQVGAQPVPVSPVDQQQFAEAEDVSVRVARVGRRVARSRGEFRDQLHQPSGRGQFGDGRSAAASSRSSGISRPTASARVRRAAVMWAVPMPASWMLAVDECRSSAGTGGQPELRDARPVVGEVVDDLGTVHGDAGAVEDVVHGPVLVGGPAVDRAGERKGARAEDQSAFRCVEVPADRREAAVRMAAELPGQ